MMMMKLRLKIDLVSYPARAEGYGYKLSQYIEMEFGIGKGTMLIMRNRKRYMTEGMELLIQKRIRKHGEKENYRT